MRRVYIVEDDSDIREIVVYALQSNGFEVMGFDRSEGFFEAIEENTPLPDLCILDLMLPSEDGLKILEKLREDPKTQKTPVIMLTAKDSESAKVKCLDMGADDYITKPFGVMELLSRINAVLRRSSSPQTPKCSLQYKKLSLDNERRTVYVEDEKVTLTFKEYELLHYLVINKGLVLTRDKLMEAVWNCDFGLESRTLDMHIRSLRQKLGTAADYIITIRNVGYKLGED